MGGSFLKGAVIGFVCAVLGGATVALAGSGINGVFNLGVSNAVNAKTTLTGSTAAAQLQVTNTSAAAGAAGLGVNSASSTATGTFANSSTGNGLSATSASGIGVFAQSGGAATPALRAKNTAGGPAAAFTVNAGVAPFTVNSATKVGSLNADQLDGLDSAALQKRVTGSCAAGSAMRVVNADGSVACQAVGSGGDPGGRIAQASIDNLPWNPADHTEATVTLTTPKAGFVLVQGSAVIRNTNHCPSCSFGVRVHDVSANADSPAQMGTVSDEIVYVTIPVQWVFPVTAGSHSYTLTTRQGFPFTATVHNPVLTAEYIPFGPPSP